MRHPRRRTKGRRNIHSLRVRVQDFVGTKTLPLKSDLTTEKSTVRLGPGSGPQSPDFGPRSRLNVKAALALHFAFANFCRVHKTLRCTLAMESGLTDHIWTIHDLIGSPQTEIQSGQCGKSQSTRSPAECSATERKSIFRKRTLRLK